VNAPTLFLETGCGTGGSLQLWRKYFGPHVQIIGIDVNPQCTAFEEDQIAVIAANGVYMVEDLHTAYWDEYGGGLHRAGSFIELCKTLLDELNAETSRGALPRTAFTRSTQSMNFYTSLAVFERGRVPAKQALIVPSPPDEPADLR